MNITVFGGSHPKPGDNAYAEALKLGYLLGSAGHNVLTGGYIGTMEAVSRGTLEAGGYVIGVTCDQIEQWRPVAPNPWINEERRFPTIRQRLFALIDDCDAALALPGGVGTLTEISVMWSHMQTLSISTRPLVLIGPGWKTVIESYFDILGEYIPDQHRDLLAFAPDVESAVELLYSLLKK